MINWLGTNRYRPQRREEKKYEGRETCKNLSEILWPSNHWITHTMWRESIYIDESQRGGRFVPQRRKKKKRKCLGLLPGSCLPFQSLKIDCFHTKIQFFLCVATIMHCLHLIMSRWLAVFCAHRVPQHFLFLFILKEDNSSSSLQYMLMMQLTMCSLWDSTWNNFIQQQQTDVKLPRNGFPHWRPSMKHNILTKFFFRCCNKPSGTQLIICVLLEKRC